MSHSQANLDTNPVRRTGRFLEWQLAQIRSGGVTVLLAKILRFVILVLVVPIAAIVWLLRPLVLIRFGRLLSQRIGHFAGNTELLLCERDADLSGGGPKYDFFFHTAPVCNQQLKVMWERVLQVTPFAEYLYSLNCLVPWGSPHVLPLGLAKQDDRDVYGLLEHTGPHLSFSQGEERSGWSSLKQMGISEQTPFICFHARDSEYLSRWESEANFHYHDYRDSSINNYVLGVEELTRRGYLAVRMGAVVKDKLHPTNSMMIDYAANGGRTDFLDIFLGAHCKFFISSGTGIDAIPMIFRRPTMFVNFVPLEYGRYWDPFHVFIPKKHWLRGEGRFLAFREILESGVGRFLQAEKFEQRGIKLIENTPEEIKAVAIEMDERLRGNWKTTPEDEKLQQRFWSLFKPSELNQVFRARIGAEFLRENRELLD